MGRPREFDTDEVIGLAMQVFWSAGYEGSSLQELLAGMGIARGSLYKAFTDKKALFLLALQRYETIAVQPAVELLSTRGHGDGWQNIRTVFDQVVATARSGDHRGCLLCTAAAGPASSDEDIAAAANRMLDQMRRGFELALAESAAHSKLAPQSRAGLAEALTTEYVGLQIRARARAPVEALEKSVVWLDTFALC
jgi:TetR/AcrR family transcriptional repressor of nem operon